MKLVFVIIINLFCTFNSVAQCIISSTCGYDVQVSITPTSIVPSTLSCPFGYNYNVTFNYSITVTGINTCYNGNIGIQPQIFCNGGQNNGYYTINIAAPTVGSGSSSVTYNGTLTTTTNQYRNLSDCNTATPSSLGCNSIDITTYGPGIPNQTINCNQSSLPIDLLSFSATNIDNQYVKLNWQTASEINNDYFLIERSKDGIIWEFVNKVKGAGNSSVLLNYQSIDEKPYNHLSYYRLKQTDFDGKYDYSEIVAVNIDKFNDSQVSLYPNPANTKISIEGSQLEIQQLKFYNIFGQDVTKLISTIEVTKQKIVVDLSNLSTGIYYVKTKTTANKMYKQ